MIDLLYIAFLSISVYIGSLDYVEIDFVVYALTN
jgi:hypothetical protein